ncbi:hypothetical protein QBC40DRAFT_326537 [Triangularia verruculosa]|uniref:FAD dependent oxidoreductase domain-containing protein n=1 Tax=Triangularia verruculosa TaxID=2587418 RepID=A0AAN6XMI8_9PEZI|nr:hypothetical protein QBC40DRAFT_326537 [Triangularia verruculosa]
MIDFTNISEHERHASRQTIAVIGAGISGVCTAVHLLREGLAVTVFERSSIAGGVWHYDGRTPVDPPYPSNTPSLGDYEISQRGDFSYATPPPEQTDGARHKNLLQVEAAKHASDLEVLFSPPGPCYAGLRNNVPTNLMASSLSAWPEGTEPVVSQRDVEHYVQSLAESHGVNAHTIFHTRVDEVRKTPDGSKWEVRSVTLEKAGLGVRFIERLSLFDRVVVASGHYNMPRIPDIKGLSVWKASFPSRIIHSKQYRNPERYRGQNVVILGAGVSALDICRELDAVANTSYQSVRGGQFDLSASILPPSTNRVPEIAQFSLDNDQTEQPFLKDGHPIPGRIILRNGQVVENIHHVVLATGYITSYPFLPHLHSDIASITESGEHVVVTSDGSMAHNLHKDIFYIPDPTLAFVGVPYHVVTFSLFDVQAQVVARVFAGRARLPSQKSMREEYERKVSEKGLGREFHSLHAMGKEVEYVRDLVEWVNEDYESEDGKSNGRMIGHSDEWLTGYYEMKAKTNALFGNRGIKDGTEPTAEGLGDVETNPYRE